MLISVHINYFLVMNVPTQPDSTRVDGDTLSAYISISMTAVETIVHERFFKF